ncbi:hypothetical protein BDN72DRAFT_838779 [Pluteus cervinus]|uniref:Uncharacterized protein n=1 Tax=Pluteus cervinus TaxID=181527 RepID=A0ACD3AZ32_9AGAR|nr:hypothetical protein BDN72DRAFT_838779 [Pluteus cervinus]
MAIYTLFVAFLTALVSSALALPFEVELSPVPEAQAEDISSSRIAGYAAVGTVAFVAGVVSPFVIWRKWSVAVATETPSNTTASVPMPAFSIPNAPPRALGRDLVIHAHV